MRQLISFLCASSVALQPFMVNAQAIGQAIRDADRPLPHVLPVADRAGQLPIAYVPAAWQAPPVQTGNTAQQVDDTRKSAVSDAISLDHTVSPTASVETGSTLTWTYTVYNFTMTAFTATSTDALRVRITLPSQISNIVVTPASGVM